MADPIRKGEEVSQKRNNNCLLWEIEKGSGSNFAYEFRYMDDVLIAISEGKAVVTLMLHGGAG